MNSSLLWALSVAALAALTLLAGCLLSTPDDAWAELTAPPAPGLCPQGEDCGEPTGPVVIDVADAGTACTLAHCRSLPGPIAEAPPPRQGWTRAAPP